MLIMIMNVGTYILLRKEVVFISLKIDLIEACYFYTMTFIEPNKMKKNSTFKNYRIYMTYISVSLLVMISGTSTGWTSPMIKKLNDTDDNPLGRPLTIDESSWLGSINILGVIAGSLICGAAGRNFGRKTLITPMGVPYLIFCLIMAFTKNVRLYIVGRFLAGITAGAAMTIVPMYVAELAKPEFRGRLFVSISIANNIGALFAYSLGPIMPFIWFHICLASIPIIFFIIFSIFAIESPYFIIRKDAAKAEERLKQLREKTNVNEEISRMKQDLQRGSDKSLIEIFKNKATRKALFISIGLGLLVMLSGGIVILSYTQYILDIAGGFWSAEGNTIIISVFQLFVTVLSSTCIDKFGRKIILSIAFTVAALTCFILGVYLILLDKGTEMSSILKWLPLISLLVYVAASSFIAVALYIGGELFSLDAKDVAIAIGCVIGGLSGFLITFLFQRVEKAIGLGQTFLIFASVSICALIFIQTVLIETKGKTLEQIQAELNGSKNIQLKV